MMNTTTTTRLTYQSMEVEKSSVIACFSAGCSSPQSSTVRPLCAGEPAEAPAARR